jgi:DNA-binding GntR family transcriptional regulator
MIGGSSSASEDGQAPDPGEALSVIAFRRIAAAIVDGRLDFGEPLSEGALSAAIGLGKAPVRAAIAELRKRHLVEIVPKAGTYVVSPGPDDIRGLCRFRFTLEAMAIQAAMERDPDALLTDLARVVEKMRAAQTVGDTRENKRLDNVWHWTFVRHCGNRFLQESYAEIALLVDALRCRFMDAAVFRAQAHDEHQAVLGMLQDGHVAKAVATIRAHIERTERFQADVRWSEGRAPRRRYRSRDYAALFARDDGWSVPDR